MAAGNYYYNRRKSESKFRKFLLAFLFILIVAALFGGYNFYRVVMTPNVWTTDAKPVSVYIPTHSTFEAVKDSLYVKGLIVNRKSFEWLANQKNYPSSIKAGRYILIDGMSNNEVINLLRGGMQTPVNVTFNNIRDVEQLASRISEQIEADSTSIVELLSDTEYIGRLGFNKETVLAMVLPNTYEFYWNTDANAFVSRIFQEYNKFWTQEKKDKAAQKNLTPLEVSILASIVDRETNKTDEMPTIAGVYLNRLKSGWYLQADPTLVFAAKDYTIRRVLDIHKLIDSPYNTYKNTGLPPGLICIPSISAINAVLNAEDHDYYFFCASENLNGYHNFAKTHLQHEQNAKKYHRALNQLNIKK